MRKDLRYGLILGGISVVWLLLMWAIGLHGEEKLSYGFIEYFYYLVPIVCISMGIKAVRSENGGYIKYGKAFGAGALISLIGIGIYGLFYYIYINMINMEYIPNKIKQLYAYYEAHPEIVEKTKMSIDELVQMASVQMDSAIANISAFVIICLLATLIIAAIYKKEQPQSIPTKEEIDAFLNEDNEEVK